ncbi:unnamed protein product [Paramecium sonneborni]|uniref:Uncharacterized protein n=1 Tax=Paramecium sonneborni TaxID=65129 RepID=A0A8S1JZJ1_9CILI|nr:unnamed protein product [Paramecium sonneborni]
MVEITTISVVFFMIDSFCLWKTQFEQSTFTMPSNWQITGAYSANRVYVCAGKSIVGGYGIVGAGSTIQGSFSNLPTHTTIKVQINVYYLQSWDEETASINVGGLVFYRMWDQNWGVNPICVTGIGKVFLETIQGSHSADTLQIIIATNLNENSYNESIGIREVYIYLKTPKCVQFYSECNYTGTMKEWCQGSPNLQRKNRPQQIKSIKLNCCGIVTLTKKGQGSITITENVPCLTEFDFPLVNNVN